MKQKPTYALDVDGTLLHYDGWKGHHHFGVPLPGAVDFTKALAKKGNVLIYTTRTKTGLPGREDIDIHELHDKVKTVLDHHGFKYHSIYIGQGKPSADYYIDDKAIEVPKNPSINDYRNILKRVK